MCRVFLRIQAGGVTPGLGWVVVRDGSYGVYWEYGVKTTGK